MKRNFKNYLSIAAKGLAMGAADVIPGVSGGTIAFISGIYEEFINALKSFDISLIKKLKNEGIAETWKHINGNFLLSLFSGILISILSLSKLIGYLLQNHAEILWSFFFGLIIASTYFIGKKIKQWNINSAIFLIVGICIAFYITIAAPTETPESTWFIVLSGAIAICAMIYPEFQVALFCYCLVNTLLFLMPSAHLILKLLFLLHLAVFLD
jgi:putative membrane protein